MKTQTTSALLARARLLGLAPCLLAPATACSTWSRRDVAPGAPVVVSDRRAVRVTRADGSVLVMTHSVIVNDSLVGVAGEPPRRVAVAVRDVERLDERRFSPARTAGLALGTVVGLAATLALFVVVAVATSGPTS